MTRSTRFLGLFRPAAATSVDSVRNHFVCTGLAFTLTELLVVMAIIAVLASLLLPTLSRAKGRAATVGCLNNVRQLQICWQMYAGDNNDCVPPNSFVYDIISNQPLDLGASWCTNLAPYDLTPDGIREGMLFRYNSSYGIYHCPADKSVVQIRGGAKTTQLRWRSYNMSQSVNGSGYDGMLDSWVPRFKKMAEILDPRPPELIVFLDVHEDEILDTMFGIPTRGLWGGWNVWWDVPANRHGQGCNFSFADGHAERWRWEVPKVVSVPRGSVQPVPPEEMDDYNRVGAGIKQN